MNITDNVKIDKGLSTFLNPYSYYLVKDNMNMLSHFDKVYCDGIIFVWMVKLLGKKVNRVSFDMTSLAPIVFKYAEDNNLSISFIGGEKGIVKKAVHNFKKRFPRLNVCYTHPGFFDDDKHRDNVISKIVHTAPDIVVVGMGAGLQEKFLLDLSNQNWHGYGYTCGGFLHQSANKEGDYYPKWINTLNLRWAYRIYKEPKLFKRYFFIYPIAVICFLKNILKNN